MRSTGVRLTFDPRNNFCYLLGFDRRRPTTRVVPRGHHRRVGDPGPRVPPGRPVVEIVSHVVGCGHSEVKPRAPPSGGRHLRAPAEVDSEALQGGHPEVKNPNPPTCLGIWVHPRHRFRGRKDPWKPTLVGAPTGVDRDRVFRDLRS